MVRNSENTKATESFFCILSNKSIRKYRRLVRKTIVIRACQIIRRIRCCRFIRNFIRIYDVVFIGCLAYSVVNLSLIGYSVVLLQKENSPWPQYITPLEGIATVLAFLTLYCYLGEVVTSIVRIHSRNCSRNSEKSSKFAYNFFNDFCCVEQRRQKRIVQYQMVRTIGQVPTYYADVYVPDAKRYCN